MLKNRVARVFNRKPADEKEYFYAAFWGDLPPHAFITDVDEEEVDTRSIESFSTTATADNLPGPGRVVDMHFYQPMCRRIERLLMRVTIRFLHPTRILAFIQWVHGGDWRLPLKDESLSQIMSKVEKRTVYGPTTVSGLKSLVRQAQSKNIYRAMASLTSLIHIATNGHYNRFFPVVSDVEPFISHVRGLVEVLEDSNPEKRYFQAIVHLAEATSILYNREDVPDGFAQDIRKRLIKLIRDYRYGQLDVLNTLTDTCHLLVLNASCLEYYKGHNHKELSYVLESEFFLLILTSHMLNELLQRNNPDSYHSRNAFISTLLIWLRTLLSSPSWSTYNLQYGDPMLLRTSTSFYCISEILSNKFNFTVCLPKSVQRVIDPDNLPRKIRATGTCPQHDSPIIKALARSLAPRTLRLLRNIHELEREVRDISLSSLRKSKEFILHENVLRRELSDEELDLARRALSKVPNNSRTWQFRDVCMHQSLYPNDRRYWDRYKNQCRTRHAWGQYFRSNLDWDWDLSGSLKRMYKPPRKRTVLGPGLYGRGGSSDTNVHVNAAPIASLTNGILEVAIGSRVTEVRIPYKSPTGEVKYRTFRDVDPGNSSSGIDDEVGHVKDRANVGTQVTVHSEPARTELIGFPRCNCDLSEFWPKCAYKL